MVCTQHVLDHIAVNPHLIYEQMLIWLFVHNNILKHEPLGKTHKFSDKIKYIQQDNLMTYAHNEMV